MNEKEVINENSIGHTFYKSFMTSLEDTKKEVKKVLGEELKMVKLLEGEVTEDASKEKVDRVSDK